jgi:hypothetical protein
MSKETDILEHAALHGFNVLLVGKHGVGKTAMVKEVFDKLKWNWKYFSASTIDPWVDLVGIPKEVDGVLELIRPANIDFDDIEAIFLDEYNRAPKKVRNAVMELIQFKSINGKKFPKLRVIFAAINPDDDEELTYDVEKLDPAQIDRFHIHLTIKSEPSAYYFKRTFQNIGSLAVKWWQEQTKEIKALISPRRLEAGVRVFMANGDPQYVFDPDKVNVGEFVEYLDKPDPIELLDDICTKTDAEKIAFLRDNNMLKHIRKDLVGKERYLKELAHCLPEAELMRELRNTKGSKIIGHVSANVDRFEKLIPVILANKTAYSARVVDAFTAYQRSKGATSSPKTLNREVTIKGKKTPVASMVVCFSGRLAGFTRQAAQELMESYGATIANSVDYLTTHLVTGERTGIKVEKAKKCGAVIIAESDFYKVVQELNSPASLITTGQTKMFKGVAVNLDDLTLENYLEKTGQRFRMEKWDKQNNISRQQAFDNMIERFRNEEGAV